MNYSFLIIYLLSTVFINPKITVGDNNLVKKDSTEIWINYSKDLNFNLEVRKAYLKKAYESTLQEKNDSLRNDYLLKISFRYYKLNDSLAFREANEKSIALSEKLQDSLNWAANYWDLGSFYSKNGIKDSAFYVYSKAQKIYNGLKNDNLEGSILLSMAIMQSDVKDFTGSEITTIKAISKLKPLKKYQQLYRCYNNLAINFNNLEQYEKAIENHEIALAYQKKIKTNHTFKENSLNNIGVVFKNKKQYQKAITNYQLALETNDLKQRNVKLYAMLLDNIAYSEFKLNNLSNTKKELYESLSIRDSINDFLGIAMSKLHLAEYYIFIKDSTKAKQYALETSLLARNTKNYRELFPSLLMLSRLDKKNSALYINEYIELNDSLQKQERIIRNKFTRIQFQTDEFISRNKQLNKQNNTILIVSGLSLLIGTLLYIIRNQRSRNKTLLFEKEQQKSNEEIYNLMIVQQQKLDEGSKIEKKRISEELHDGVLGKLFGIRLILANLNSSSDEETVLKREKHIKDLQEIEEEIRNVSHELNDQSLLSNSNVGYTKILEMLIEDQSKVTYFNFDFKSDNAIRWEEKEGSLKINLYRIIQEAIQNINKHAKAKHVSVEFRVDKNGLILLVKDDGLGFNQSTANKGIGLRNIRSRVKKINGKVEIISSLNNGTSVIITIPNN